MMAHIAKTWAYVASREVLAIANTDRRAIIIGFACAKFRTFTFTCAYTSEFVSEVVLSKLALTLILVTPV